MRSLVFIILSCRDITGMQVPVGFWYLMIWLIVQHCISGNKSLHQITDHSQINHYLVWFIFFSIELVMNLCFNQEKSLLFWILFSLFCILLGSFVFEFHPFSANTGLWFEVSLSCRFRWASGFLGWLYSEHLLWFATYTKMASFCVETVMLVPSI